MWSKWPAHKINTANVSILKCLVVRRGRIYWFVFLTVMPFTDSNVAITSLSVYCFEIPETINNSLGENEARKQFIYLLQIKRHVAITLDEDNVWITIIRFKIRMLIDCTFCLIFYRGLLLIVQTFMDSIPDQDNYEYLFEPVSFF